MSKIILLQGVYLGKENNALGQKMMHGFLKMLSKSEWQPKALFFLGDAVRLLTNDFDVLSYLQCLQEKGIELLACRAAVEDLDLTGKILVGKISSTGSLITLMEKYEVISL